MTLTKNRSIIIITFKGFDEERLDFLYLQRAVGWCKTALLNLVKSPLSPLSRVFSGRTMRMSALKTNASQCAL